MHDESENLSIGRREIKTGKGSRMRRNCSGNVKILYYGYKIDICKDVAIIEELLYALQLKFVKEYEKKRKKLELSYS